MQRRVFNNTIFIVFLLLLAFSLRILDAGNWSVRFDEALSVWEAQMGFLEMTEFTARDVHPPLYFWILHIWLRLVGSSEFAVRSLSIFCGTLSTLTIYSLTWQLSKSKIAAILAMLLVTLSPFHIHWSQDARMYALTMFCAGIAVYAHWRGWNRMLALGGIGMVLSHYFGVIVVGVLILHRLFHYREHRRGNRPWIIAIAFILVVIMVWGVYAIGLIRKDPGFATFDPAFTFQLMVTLFTFGEPNFLYSHFPYILVVTAIFFVGLALNWHEHRRATSLVVFGAALSPIFIALLALPFVPVHVNSLQERHFAIFSPFVFTGYGIGFLALLRRRRLTWVGIITCAGLLVLYTVLTAERRDEHYFKDDYRTMMAAVAALTDADDTVFYISGGRKPVIYYHLERVGYDVPKNAHAELVNVKGIPRSSHQDVSATMEWIFAGIDRFWLIEIEAHLDEPLDAPLQWIKDNFFRIYHIPVAWNAISLYSSDETDSVAEIDTIVPPMITEARPGDQVRIGVPAGATVDLVHSGQTVDSHSAETWMLHQFDIYPFYFNGIYELRVADRSYPFVITHSQDFPDGP
ncbi:MAG: glycosyltransferase family 39 protein [Chloroflexi bacterium]|nr:glycosyltransferase family 39 protein [Chloroflexota bacterium]